MSFGPVLGNLWLLEDEAILARRDDSETFHP